METVTMADVLYIPVDEETGEPYLWGLPEEPCITVFGDFWRCRADAQSTGKAIRAVALEDIPKLLDGRWSHIGEISYHPSADAYTYPKQRVMEMAAARAASLEI